MRLDTTGGRLPHAPAVYVITHTESGRRYVGSTTDMAKRAEAWRRLRLPRKQDASPMTRLLLRDGHAAFDLVMVEYVPDTLRLRDREAWWIAALATSLADGGLNALRVVPGRGLRTRPLAPAHATVARLAYATGRCAIQQLASTYNVSFATMRRHLLGA